MSDQKYQIPLDRTANVPITEGLHPFKITSGDESEGPKGPYWKFDLSCLTPSEGGKSPKPLYISLAPQSRWKLEIFLDAVGAPGKGAATIDKFIGRTFRGQVTHEVYEGRTQAAVGEMWPMTAAPGSKPTATAAKAVPVAVTVKSASASPTVAEAQANLPTDTVGDETPPPF
jgi:hypothetical protein